MGHADCGGAIAAPSSWLGQIRSFANDRQIPLVFDEVQTGEGRTGRMYGFQHSEVVPDVLVLSKAIGGGLPWPVRVGLGAFALGGHPACGPRVSPIGGGVGIFRACVWETERI